MWDILLSTPSDYEEAAIRDLITNDLILRTGYEGYLCASSGQDNKNSGDLPHNDPNHPLVTSVLSVSPLVCMTVTRTD